MKYKKKPVQVEAIQYKGNNIDECAAFLNTCVINADKTITVHTLEGDMKANVGDYLIKGVAGEFYPCKPDIFEKTYTTADTDKPYINISVEAGKDRVECDINAALIDIVAMLTVFLKNIAETAPDKAMLPFMIALVEKTYTREMTPAQIADLQNEYAEAKASFAPDDKRDLIHELLKKEVK